MPTRIIRDGILTSEPIATLGWPAECFYRRLMSVVDDYGRYYALPALLRAACYPLHLDKVSDSDIGKWLTACVNAALVRVYLAQDGKRYVEMQKFGQRVQSKSRFPDPTGGCGMSQDSTVNHGESPESTALVGDGVGVALNPTLATQATGKVVIALTLNDGSEHPITEDQAIEFAELYPAVDITAQLRAIRGWCTNNPQKRKTKAGVMRFVNSWLAKEQDNPRTRHANSTSSRKLSAVEQVERAIADRPQQTNCIEGEVIGRLAG